ncbi:MAG: hypothetical protein U9R66_05305 [Thermodesulfobacteriota bacterium]|nr:hypothetical protein [Thermodesulfobacteriota bacterium]
MKKIYLTLMAFGMTCFLYQPIYAQTEPVDVINPEITDDITVEVETDTEPELSGSKFSSRPLLNDTLLAGLPSEEPPAEDPEETGGETPEGDTVAEADVTPEDIPEDELVENEVPEVSDEDRVAAFVESLSDEQVFALNRSLNNAIKSDLPMVYDMDLLEKIVENDYGKKEINAIAKALEQEARFTALAEKTGNEKFLDKALDHKNKFLTKADSSLVDEAVQVSAGVSAKESAKYSVKQAAKHSAKVMAKQSAKDSAKQAAKETAKGAAKEAAKGAAKQVAKDSAKLAAKEAAKSAAKQAAKNVAKQAAKETVKEMQKQNNGKGKNKKS